jgi:hypothetical protein
VHRGRRFLLIGLFVIWPFHQGSVMQLATANLVALVYLVWSLQAMPYVHPFEYTRTHPTPSHLVWSLRAMPDVHPFEYRRTHPIAFHSWTWSRL